MSRSHGTRRSFPLSALSADCQIVVATCSIWEPCSALCFVGCWEPTLGKLIRGLGVIIRPRNTTAAGSLVYDDTTTILTVTGRACSIRFPPLSVLFPRSYLVKHCRWSLFSRTLVLFSGSSGFVDQVRLANIELFVTTLNGEFRVQGELDTYGIPDRLQSLRHNDVVFRYPAQVRTRATDVY